MRTKLLFLFTMILISAMLTGCWDRIDIESRGYVLGIAIDKYPPIPQAKKGNMPGETPPKEEVKVEHMETHTGKDLFAMTVQLPIMKKSSDSSSGGGSGSSGGGESSKTWEITQIGNSFLSMNREMQSRTDLSLYYEHLQVIILSERIARDGLEDVIDFFVRDPEMRRRVRVFISTGEAKSVLNVTPKIEDYSAIYLAQLPLNASKTSRIVHKTDLGEVIQSIHAGFDFVLPMVVPTEDETKASGAAAFKGGRMVGWLSEIEVEAFKFIRNIYMGGVIAIPNPDGEDGIIVLDITGAKTEVIPVIENENLSFTIKIKVKGDYGEEVNMHTHSKLSQGFLEKLEQGYAREIERICQATVSRMQTEYGADIFRFCQVLAIKEPAYWKKIEDKWDIIYPNVDVIVQADVSIELLGIIQ